MWNEEGIYAGDKLLNPISIKDFWRNEEYKIVDPKAKWQEVARKDFKETYTMPRQDWVAGQKTLADLKYGGKIVE